ncbi:Secreted and surface protein containing fasciclin-like repeats [[Synechococcus] sp. NIES-970]|uniref:fasciclin domain-containing protein n=1 Tax=Picosynechococcus sp. NKBG15041c TaxID=1407650 RepID=UPI000414E496|nr:fasciclin domain-containing protein [Picosynechococcus sp. NKBG15041c]BAW97138.1 Secreted and surface protein containing fasciclin-like repeats [[Synechococcus] sp. NIES-970]
MRFTKTLALTLALGSAIGFGTVAQAGGHGEQTKPYGDQKKPAAEMPATEMPAAETEVETEAEAAMTAPTIVDIAASNEAFSTLVAAVSAADLAEVLAGEGPFTVFAPTNDAFAALPDGVLESLLLPENKDLLTQILTYHVVSGNVMSSDLTEGAVETVEGSDILVGLEDDGVQINQANVLMADIEASNGVIHVIDSVILPPALLAEAEIEAETEVGVEAEMETEEETAVGADVEAEVDIEAAL